MAEHLPVTYNVPPEIYDSVKLNVAYLIKLCPGWVHSLECGWERKPKKGDKNTICTIYADYKYRRVYLTFFPAWIHQDADQRRHTIVHEAVHILTAPIHEFYNDSIREMFERHSDTDTLLEGAWTAVNEAVTEDIAILLIDLAQKEYDRGYDRGVENTLTEYGLEDEIEP